MTDMGQGFCIWLTGLSASGKTTLAGLLENAIRERGFKVQVLDGEEMRKTLSQGLGFSRADRETHLRRLALVAKMLIRHQVVAIVAAISPYQSIRAEVRGEIGEFVEVHLSCPLEVCIRRDPKGLYRRALAGEINNFTGIDDPFEEPRGPEVRVKTDAETAAESLGRILGRLEELGRLRPETKTLATASGKRSNQIG